MLRHTPQHCIVGSSPQHCFALQQWWRSSVQCIFPLTLILDYPTSSMANRHTKLVVGNPQRPIYVSEEAHCQNPNLTTPYIYGIWVFFLYGVHVNPTYICWILSRTRLYSVLLEPMEPQQHSLCIEVNDLPFHLRREKLALQFVIKIATNPNNPVNEVIFIPQYVELFSRKQRVTLTSGILVRESLEEFNACQNDINSTHKILCNFQNIVQLC